MIFRSAIGFRSRRASFCTPRFPRPLRRLGKTPLITLGLWCALQLIATIGSPGLGASESQHAAQEDHEVIRQHFAGAQRQKLASGWRQDLMSIPVDAICNNVKRQDLIPYRLGPLLARGDPDDIISRGWTESRRPPFQLVAPINWSYLRAVDRSWNYLLNAWRPLQAILERHSQTSQTDYLSFAVAVAEDWIRQHPYAHRLRHTADEDFSWYDMAVGRRIPQLAYILDAACRESSINIERLAPLWRSLLDHFDYLSDDRNIVFHSNHGFYQAAGQFLAAVRFSNHEQLAVFEAQAVDRLLQMIDRHYSSEGVHLEHSSDYQRSVTRVISTLAQAGLSGRIPSLQEHTERMNDALAWMILPNQRTLNFGDSDRVDFGDPDRADFSRRRGSRSGSDLLDFAISGGVSGKGSSQSLAVFPKSGLAVIRSDWAGGEDFQSAAYLAQTAAFHSRVHKQADDLSFVWYDRGNDILIDAGRYGYLGRTKRGSDLWEQGFWYSDPKRIYVESTRAHNTVEIDGKSFDRKRSKPYGSAIERWGETEDGLFFIETHARQFRTIRHARVLVMNPHEWLLVFDWVWDNRKWNHEYRQWFHFAPELTVIPSGRTLTVSGEDLGTELKVVSLLPSPSLSVPVRGQKEPTLLGWWSEEGGQFEPVTSVNFHIGESPSAVFATLFAFSDEGVCSHVDNQRVNTSGRNARFQWSMVERTHTLSLDRPAEGGVTIDYAIQSRSDGASTSVPKCNS